MSLIRFSLLASILVGLASCSSVPPKTIGPETPGGEAATTSEPGVIPSIPPGATTFPPTTIPRAPINALLRPASFASLPGWSADDQRQALPALMASCAVLSRREEWRAPCIHAAALGKADLETVRNFFEKDFKPYRVTNPDGSTQGLVTGYYEPLLHGSRKRGGPYQTPLHKAPNDLLTIDLASAYPEFKGMRLRGKVVGNKVVPYPSREELMRSNALSGDEILWVDDPIDAFFLQVQGSGRVQLAGSNEVVRIAYADQNGLPYKSIGRYLIDKGELTLSQASAQGIKKWLAAHPAREQELLNANPRYIFFKEEKLVDPNEGPKGALGVPLTPMRSIAVDRDYIPLGAPVFLSTTEPNSSVPLRRLVMAQDTGSAIKNAVRADYFWGFGDAAGEEAGKMKQRGQMWVLLPK